MGIQAGSSGRDQAGVARYSIRAVERVCDILAQVYPAGQGISVSEMSESVELPNSTLFRYLTVLQDRGFIERDPATKLYYAGSFFLQNMNQHETILTSVARPILSALRDRLNVTVNLGVYRSGKVEHLLVLPSNSPLRLAAEQGSREPVHSTALGKAIAATMSPTVVTKILDVEGMGKITGNTITNHEKFFQELSNVNTLGYALDESENQLGGTCLAVALKIPLEVQAAISFSSPSAQLPTESVPRMSQYLQEAAREITQEFLLT